jgi:hypothetical protein
MRVSPLARPFSLPFLFLHASICPGLYSAASANQFLPLPCGPSVSVEDVSAILYPDLYRGSLFSSVYLSAFLSVSTSFYLFIYICYFFSLRRPEVICGGEWGYTLVSEVEF